MSLQKSSLVHDMLPIVEGDNGPVFLFEFTRNALDVSNNPEFLKFFLDLLLPNAAVKNPVILSVFFISKILEMSLALKGPNIWIDISLTFQWIPNCVLCSFKWRQSHIVEKSPIQRNDCTINQMISYYLSKSWTKALLDILILENHQQILLQPLSTNKDTTQKPMILNVTSPKNVGMRLLFT